MERREWRCAQRDDRRLARRLWKKPAVEALSSLDAGAIVDECVHFLDEVGGLPRWQAVQGDGLTRELGAFCQSVMLYGRQTVCGMEARHALPALLCSDEAAMRLAGGNAVPRRDGLCQRRHAKRQGAQAPGPLCPDTWADNIVTLSLEAMAACRHGVGQDLAQAKVFARQVTGIVEGTDLETTARSAGCGQATRQRQRTDTRGQGREIAVTVYGWKLRVMIEVRTTRPLAATVGQSQAHAASVTRALVRQAQATLARHARLRRVVCARGCLDGADRWWLAPQDRGLVVPATEHRRVTAAAQALAAAGPGVVARRVPTVPHGQGTQRGTARLDTAVVGLTAVTTSAQYGPEEHAQHQYHQDFAGDPLHAVVGRTWHKRDEGPGGTGVLLTNEVVAKPWNIFDTDDDRRRMEHCGIKERQHAWHLQPPPKKRARAVQGHVCFPLALCALATAYRVRAAPAAGGRAGGLAALAPPADPTAPRHSDDLCPGVVWDLPCGGRLPPAGGEMDSTATGAWESP